MFRNAFISAALLASLIPTSHTLAQVAYDPEARLAELKITLPPVESPVGNFVNAVRTGNLLFLAGHGECREDFLTGQVGTAVTTAQAYDSARRVGVCLLATLKAELGDLRRVKRVVKVLGMVNAAPQFKDHPKVINGCSDLLVSVFGQRGRHARSAVGMSSLPANASVEIEMVVEIDDAK